MKSILKNTAVLIFAIIVGGLVNMGLVIFGPVIIPAPSGVDVTDVESIAASMHLFEPKHFIFPFLAHAIGTLTGAVVAYMMVVSHSSVFAYVIGGVFMLGGIVNAFMIPSPVWYLFVDLLAAYIPMAWLGTIIGKHIRKPPDSGRSLIRE